MTDVHLKSGLYIVPTPIGNLKDITLRALDVLNAVDVIYCEDTRVTQKLLSHYGIQKPLRIYNDHSTQQDRDKMITQIESGSVALVSDAGMPLICDPGYKLIQNVREKNLYVCVLPGACAFVTALAGTPLENDHFSFFGFFNPKKMDLYKSHSSTLIFYESCHSILKTLKLCQDAFPNRTAAIGRELTKLFEETITGTCEELYDYYTQHSDKCRGEFVFMLSKENAPQADEKTIKEELENALYHYRGKEAIEFVAKKLNVSKKIVYALYTKLKEQ
ncbi:MAG: Ribosomal RNA small subunit methyltransferase I [Holosporales bacterium]